MPPTAPKARLCPYASPTVRVSTGCPLSTDGIDAMRRSAFTPETFPHWRTNVFSATTADVDFSSSVFVDTTSLLRANLYPGDCVLVRAAVVSARCGHCRCCSCAYCSAVCTQQGQSICSYINSPSGMSESAVDFASASLAKQSPVNSNNTMLGIHRDVCVLSAAVMRDLGLHDGDVVIVTRQQSVPGTHTAACSGDVGLIWPSRGRCGAV